MKEIWKDVAGYEKRYSVSNKGNVKTLNYKRTGKKKLLAKSNNGNGYYRIPLYSGEIPFVKRHKYIHEIVLETFVGKRPNGYYACHLDGDRHNNRIDNLRWDTPKNNSKDNILNGTRLLGEKCHTSILTENQVIKIFELVNKRINTYDIADLFGINQSTVSSIAKGQRWKHLSHLRTVGQYSTRRTNNKNYVKPLVIVPFK